jgi:hypothetical protein
MLSKSHFRLFVALAIFALLFTSVGSVHAEGAPYPPTLISPGNGEMSSSNPPTLCAQTTDPDGNLQSIKFEVNGGGEGDHISPWIQVDGNGYACWQDNVPWSEQEHAWQARAVDTGGNQSGASGQWNIKIPTTAPPPETCRVDDLYADRSAPQAVGTTVNFTVNASCTNGVNRIDTFVDGSGMGTINGGSGSIAWNTSGYIAGNHVFSVQVFGKNGGTAGRSHPYDLSNSEPPPPASVTCSTKNINASPQSPQASGTQIRVTAKGDCNTGLRAMKLLVNNSQVWEDGGNLNATWNTNGYGDGTYSLKILTCGVGDNNCSQADVKSFDFVLKSGSGSTPSDPNKAFGNCEAIKIGYDVFVITKEGSAIQRRHVPNPTTLDALGFGQSAINNKGFSDQELKTIGQGSDIPDVVVDPSGFNTFKSTFCPNTTPIVPGQQNQNPSGISTPTGQQHFDPHAEGVCEGQETRMWLGEQGRITSQGDNLKLRDNPTTSGSYKVKMPEGYRFYAIGGPTCADGYTWWQITGTMGTGWSAERGEGGKGPWWMAPIEEAPEVLPPAEVIPTEPPVQENETETEQPIVEVPNDEPEEKISLWCAYIGWFCNVVPEAMGAEPNPVNLTCKDQCVITARNKRDDLKTWSMGNADDILKVATGMIKFPHDGQEMQVRVRTDKEKPQTGDLIIWSSTGGCGAWSGGGHIGYVSNGDPFRITDSNWGTPVGLATCYKRDDKPAKIDPCMKFVTSPFPAGSPDPSLTPAVDQCDQYPAWSWQRFQCKFNPFWKPFSK